MLPIDREQLAWAAGAFDGEGWACAARYHPVTKGMTATLTLGVAQAHQELVDRVHSAVGGLGTVFYPKRIVPWRTPMFNWRVYGFQDVQAVFAMLWPWLGSVKKQKIASVLADAKLHPSHQRRHFSNRQVAIIKRRLADGERQCDLAREFSVPRPVLWAISHGRSYRNIQMERVNAN